MALHESLWWKKLSSPFWRPSRLSFSVHMLAVFFKRLHWGFESYVSPQVPCQLFFSVAYLSLIPLLITIFINWPATGISLKLWGFYSALKTWQDTCKFSFRYQSSSELIIMYVSLLLPWIALKSLGEYNLVLVIYLWIVCLFLPETPVPLQWVHHKGSSIGISTSSSTNTFAEKSSKTVI